MPQVKRRHRRGLDGKIRCEYQDGYCIICGKASWVEKQIQRLARRQVSDG